MNELISKTPEYRSWSSMRQRCDNPKNKRYSRYGGRGITVCPEWQVFAQFLADMGKRPEGHTLERVNNDGNYDPSNCRWATPKEQQNNMRRNVRIEHNGEYLTIAQWSRKTGLNTVTIRARLRRGWSIEQVFNPDISHRYKRPVAAKVYPPCAVQFCGRPAQGHGEFCKRHYAARRYGSRISVLPKSLCYGRAKLTIADIPALRAAIASGEPTKQIAREFGVCGATVRDIARGETWKGIGL